MEQGKASKITKDDQGILHFGKRIFVLHQQDLKELILKEAHESAYLIHPGGTKMYQDLKQQYWWPRMKRDIAEPNIKSPLACYSPYRYLSGNGKRLAWTSSLVYPRPGQVKTTYKGDKLAELYMSRIVSLHGVPKRIVSDRGSQFTFHFWDSLHEALGIYLAFSTAYHPQTDGQTERVNQVLEDMLRACAIEFAADWEKCLPYAEFAYNNSYQSSLKMSPFEALYGRRCRTPLLWSEAGEGYLFGLDCLKEAEDKLKKCLRMPEEQTRVEDIELVKDLAYAEYPVEILEVAEKQTRNRVYRLCKVRWSNHIEGEATWEREDLLKAEYPQLFDN
uniref:Putative retrotransposon protein n=1 Tax=Phyllostachys edulis TaxID=38705 RepID=D3IVS6_PHYED|nr:putative retrotransposon protein [Phyllostachys edulis]